MFIAVFNIAAYNDASPRRRGIQYCCHSGPLEFTGERISYKTKTPAVEAVVFVCEY